MRSPGQQLRKFQPFLWILAAVLLLPVLTGYRVSPQLFSGEWRTVTLNSHQVEVAYPGNWRVYQGGIRGHKGGLLQIFDDLDMDGNIYIEHAALSEPTQENIIQLRRSQYCKIFSMFCEISEQPWQVDPVMAGAAPYDSVTFELTTKQGVVIYRQETFVIGHNELFTIGVSARNKDTFDSLLPTYNGVLSSFRFIP